jgi:REP element-mobilizing transposase RayT
MRRIPKTSHTYNERYEGKHRFEHWYRDNQVYFITARCRDRTPAFASERAKAVFWDRFDLYASKYSFTPWVTTLLDNHYHTLGYLKIGTELKHLMQKLHGSVAKLVNDLLPQRLTPFWWDAKHRDYMDGCIRDELQCRRAYRYVLTQSVRHGIVKDWREYPHTRVNIELERALKRAIELKAFLEGVPYPRYSRRNRQSR